MSDEEQTEGTEQEEVVTSAQAEEDLPPKRPPQKMLRRFIYVGQAIAIAAVAAYGAVRPTGEREARVGYSETAQHIATLQAYVLANDKAMKQLEKKIERQTRSAAGRCKAEVQSIRMYVTGYLLALSRNGHRSQAEQRKTDEALQKLLKGAAKESGVTKAAPPPPAPAPKPVPKPALRKPPASLDAVLQQQQKRGL